MKMHLREWTRRSIPGSTQMYEWVHHQRRKRQSQRQVASLLQNRQPLLLDLGGGYKPGSHGWLNVDVSPQCDFYWNLAEPMPFPDSSVDGAYSSHLLEHLTFGETQTLLQEVLRILKPGAQFRVCVPNARIFIDHYLGDHELPMEFFGWRSAFNDSTRIDALNYVAYLDGEHKYMFDEENLQHVLSRAGFDRVARRDFDPSIDLLERDSESIYAVGYKPQ